MRTDNSAIVTPDLLADVTWLVDAREAATPVEFHSLNSLVEAVVFHETIYLYDWPQNRPRSGLHNRLIEEGIIHPDHSPGIFEKELEARDMKDVANNVLLDRTYGSRLAAYHPKEGISALSALIEYEKYLGFARMSQVRDMNEDLALLFANARKFNHQDLVIIDDTYRRARAFAGCATQLNLEMYTGLVNRPFLLGFLSARRRGSLALYDQMKTELDDVDNTDIPSWRRIQIPPLTQTLLRNCIDRPEALADELLELRVKLRKFRKTLTDQAAGLRNAKSRGEKRKVRRESEKAWVALLEKQDRSTRITHQLWDIAKNPLKAPIVAVDKAVERDKLDQATLKVQGLTDLWRTLYDAPTIEQNVSLIKKVFAIEFQSETWKEFAKLAGELESLMTRNEEPNLPSEMGQ